MGEVVELCPDCGILMLGSYWHGFRVFTEKHDWCRVNGATEAIAWSGFNLYNILFAALSLHSLLGGTN